MADCKTCGTTDPLAVACSGCKNGPGPHLDAMCTSCGAAWTENPTEHRRAKMQTERARLRLAEGPAPALPTIAAVTWTAGDVGRFLRTTGDEEEIGRKTVARLEKEGHKLRLPSAIVGRRCVVYAARFLKAAGLSDEEIRGVLPGGGC